MEMKEMDAISQFGLAQIIMASLSLTIAGVIGFWCKDMPLRLWGFVKRQCTTTVDITSAHNAYYNFMKFIEDHYGRKNFRTFKLTNGKWGNNDIATIGLGYGGHFIRYEKLLMYAKLTTECHRWRVRRPWPDIDRNDKSC